MRPDDYKQNEIPRRTLLYDKDVLESVYRDVGPESEIKRHVKTGATIYEIRSALKYWLGVDDGVEQRISQRIINTCAAVDDGVAPAKAEGVVVEE
jgi:hypothetical protein